jgi:hypothetical protein
LATALLLLLKNNNLTTTTTTLFQKKSFVFKGPVMFRDVGTSWNFLELLAGPKSAVKTGPFFEH